ncbi:thioredoxin domain-containing protein [Sphingosinicella sp. BN140058]|uniref:thioredoxin domain-containing protein n=1 Tax=Sphingosinicella sp. BN140058 TaxID=1892855 RepID=UPI0010106BFD|nr:thioredoxin domain-containing protein [Sphingosinicella sp. BN140058]QAY76235.1 protein-disulfide isomerase [Sphingosinicella sp. BN140058]
MGGAGAAASGGDQVIGRGLGLALGAIGLAGGLSAALVPADAAPARKAPAARPAPARDWTRTIVQTPEGGYRMGNPAAPVKLVEYGSLTCPHCADFSAGAKAGLEAKVRTGKVSYEFRNFVLNGIDVAATLVARCASPANYFRLTENLYATQKQWVGRISGLSQAEKDKLKALPEGERLGRLADIGGLTQLAARAGVTPQRAKACLTDPAGLARLEKIAEAAEAQGVSGTPTFFVNGANVGTGDWAYVESFLQ